MATKTHKTTLVDEIMDYLNRFMAFSDYDEATGHSDQAFAIAIWAISTWTFGEFFPRSPFVTPYIYVGSPEPECGKSTLIEITEPLVLNPAKMIGLTSSVLFRLIESKRPVLFIDEADQIWTGSSESQKEMNGAINGGYKLGGYIWRNVPGPDGPEPQQFSTFCPKFIAGIDNDKLPETIAGRCIPIRLRRKPKDVHRESYYSFMFAEVQAELQRKIETWVRANGEKIIAYMPKPGEDLSDRRFEISIPLLQIAHVMGIEARTRKILANLLGARIKKDTPGVKLLKDIRRIFDESGADRLHTATIAEELGEGWTQKLLTKRLEPYDVGATAPILIGNVTLKGYYRHQFADAWERYCA